MQLTLPVQANFPSTRYMGSKQTILEEIWAAIGGLKFDTVLDAFSGSGAVSYMFKAHGKSVISNDYLRYAYTLAHAVIANYGDHISPSDIRCLLEDNPRRQSFIQNTFRGLYFSDEDNLFLDNTVANIAQLSSPYKKSLALAALSRACIKRRPRGVFTYVGERYDDGRRDLRLTLKEHFVQAVASYNDAVFDNGLDNIALNEDVFSLDVEADLVYLDPPYFTPLSDNDYLRRYHFVEGLCRYWHGVEILQDTATKKLRKYPTPFSSRKGTYDAFRRLFHKYRGSTIVVSYSSNGLPSRDELLEMLQKEKGKDNVDIATINHRYSFGTHSHKAGNRNNTVQEYLFIAS